MFKLFLVQIWWNMRGQGIGDALKEPIFFRYFDELNLGYDISDSSTSYPFRKYLVREGQRRNFSAW